MVSVRGLHDLLGLERERTTCIAIPEVNPEDVFLISVLLEDGLKALLETIDRGLACAEDGEARKLATELINKNVRSLLFSSKNSRNLLNEKLQHLDSDQKIGETFVM